MDLTGVQLGKYRVVEQVNAGGMAQVYKAYQPDLDRYVAIKVIAADLGRDPAFLEQFEREAKTLARLEHPNILPIYDSGHYGDMPYLVTQYVQAGTLADRLGKPLPIDEATGIISQLGDALGYAHARGVVHRDVKPSNALVTPSGHVLLADFGIAQAIESQGKAGATSGTPAYMAPEQRKGQPVDGRADIYALGVMLYELLSGKHSGEQNLITRSLNANLFIHPALLQVIGCATAEAPEDRYEVTEELVAAVQEAALKASGEYAESPSTTQQALEAVLIAMLTVVGIGLILYAGNAVFLQHESLSTWMGAFTAAAACLLCDAMLVTRDRSRSISLSFIGSMVLVILGCISLTIPLDLLATGGKVPPEAWGMLLMFFLPGVLMFLAAAGLYAFAHRQPSSEVKRNIPRSRPIVARRARFTPSYLRRARNTALKYLIAAILTAAVARVIANVAPRGSPIVGIAQEIMGLSVYVLVLMGAAFVVWYAYSQVTLAATETADSSSPQVASKAKEHKVRLDKAREYRERIREAIAQTREGPLRERLQSATERLDEWVSHVEHLTARLDELERDPVLRRDLSTVPRAVDSLEARLALEEDTDTGVREAVQQTLAARQSQLLQLRALERVKTQAELYSEETVAALGTIYSQVLLVDAKNIEGGRAQRLRAGIDEQVKVLRDLLDAMDKVQERGQTSEVLATQVI